MFMNTSTFNNKKDPFKELSSEWWDENGKFQLYINLPILGFNI